MNKYMKNILIILSFGLIVNAQANPMSPLEFVSTSQNFIDTMKLAPVVLGTAFFPVLLSGSLKVIKKYVAPTKYTLDTIGAALLFNLSNDFTSSIKKIDVERLKKINNPDQATLINQLAQELEAINAYREKFKEIHYWREEVIKNGGEDIVELCTKALVTLNKLREQLGYAHITFSRIPLVTYERDYQSVHDEVSPALSYWAAFLGMVVFGCAFKDTIIK